MILVDLAVMVLFGMGGTIYFLRWRLAELEAARPPRDYPVRPWPPQQWLPVQLTRAVRHIGGDERHLLLWVVVLMWLFATQSAVLLVLLIRALVVAR